MTDPQARHPVSADVVTARAALPDGDFRFQFREWLRSHHPGRPPKREERVPWVKAWNALLVDEGWAAPSWPVEHGGMNLPFAKQVIYTEEFARANVPSTLGTGIGIAGPTIITHGTPDQQRRWLRPMIRADVVWAQGYSEPGSGSDLPSLITSAVREGDEYLVSGQKVWSSSANIADRIFTLVRTGEPGSRQHGISYLIIDAHAPGVEVRPIKDMTGGADFCEVFFDEVRVPVADRVGEENKGWAIARTSLGHERAAGALQQAMRYRRVLSELIELAQIRGLTSDPLIRQRLADFVIRQRISEYSGMRTISGITKSGEPGPQSSVSRLASSLFEQELHVLAVDLLGPYATLDRRAPDAVQGGRWVWGFLRTRASTIGAGTAEIQRNTAGERVLGLPHEPELKGS